MLKSLFSGVAGLQSHQIAMDVESNNIANVNTTGFKYSRANFSDLLAQTKSIATAPQGSLGGKNAVQVGLGSTVSSMTRIFSQGSIQNSDKNTDVAIQGDGFFIISPDGGNTYKYTRAGDFKFDAGGNFVDNNGFITQGWLRDLETGKVDSNDPVKDINIPPGLTTPAFKTENIALKANLNSGPRVESFTPAYSIDSAGTVEGTPANDSGDVGFMFNGTGDAFSLQDNQGVEISFDGGASYDRYLYDADATHTTVLPAVGVSPKIFRTVNELRSFLQEEANAVSNGAVITVNSRGQIEVDNSAVGTSALTIDVRADTTAGASDNPRFTANMAAMKASLPAQSTSSAFTQSFNAATHASSIDVFDSLGTKHTVRMEFRKVGSKQWDMLVSVPSYAKISPANPQNELRGQINFNSDGSLVGSDITTLRLTANNGSEGDQAINLGFGTQSAFDGMTSFDSPSSTSGISQDGYTGGDLVGIRIDQSGTLIGSFSNGRSFGLAQIAMAKFTNNEGLSVEGGNVYIQTANSGDPIIGTAATSGRGFIQSAALEASNVDLSRALTQLIIIQRGFQANGKTITTSDQLLQTLIGLKN